MMNKLNWSAECVTMKRCRLLFADDLVWVNFSESALQHGLNVFVAASNIAGMKLALPKLRYYIFRETLSKVLLILAECH